MAQLLKLNADANARNKAGKTPLDVTKELDGPWKAALLKQYGAHRGNSR